MKKFYLLLAFLISLFLCSQLFAVGTETTPTGLAITRISDGIRIDRFVNYTLGTSNSYIYNNSGSSTPSDAGSYYVLPYRVKSVRVDITGLKDAGTTTIGIFHADGTTTIWSTSAEIIYSGTQSASFDISENPEYQRIGAKRSGTSSATLRITETCLKNYLKE